MYVAHLKLDITPLAGKARSLDPELNFLLQIPDGEQRVEKGEVLLDIANHSSRGRLHFDLLQAAETAPCLAPQRPLHVDHLDRSIRESLKGFRTRYRCVISTTLMWNVSFMGKSQVMTSPQIQGVYLHVHV